MSTPDIMTVRDLHEILTAALLSGIDPSTAVVIGDSEHTWFETSLIVGDPSTDGYDYETGEGNGYIWFTLFTAAPADPRSTPEHVTRCGYCGTFGHYSQDCPEREVTS